MGKKTEFCNCTGKLNDHDDYLKIIKLLRTKSSYIEYALVDKGDTRLIEKFENLVVSVRPANKWWGTKSSQKCKVYKIKASKELFQYLRGFETFCKYKVSEHGDVAERTDFGINDIAFFDENEFPLLYTTTHEGYITFRGDLLM